MYWRNHPIARAITLKPRPRPLNVSAYPLYRPRYPINPGPQALYVSTYPLNHPRYPIKPGPQPLYTASHPPYIHPKNTKKATQPRAAQPSQLRLLIILHIALQLRSIPHRRLELLEQRIAF